MLRPLAAITAASLLLLAPSAHADIPAPPSQWYKLPGLNAASGAQWVRAFAHSTPPNVIYAGLEGGGVFRSQDGGVSWSPFNGGFANPLTTNVRALLASSTGTTVYAGTDTGVWKSDGGNWEPVGQGPGPDKLNGSVQALFSVPGGPMLAGVASGGVWRSSDGGDTWTPPAPGNGMPTSETPYGFVGQPSQAPAFILSASSNGVFRSSDNGATWTLASDGIPGSASPIQPWVDESKPNLMYVSTASNGIYRSINGGITWHAINNGLGAVRARGFQIFTASEGAHLYAATEEGLWEALNTHSTVPPPPKWKAVTQEGLIEASPPAQNVIMWALTAPVIPGAGGAFGLIAGTQSNGGYFLSFEPPGNTCPTPANATASCPDINDLTPIAGQELTATPGNWTGTETIEYAYQWQRCTTANADSCSDITDAEENTYVIPEDGNNVRYRVKVTATNPAPTFDQVFRFSVLTGLTAAPVNTMPGYNQVFPPDIDVLDPGSDTSPQPGDTMFAGFGANPNPPTHDGFFNPPADNHEFQWFRCNGSGADCEPIVGATAREYTLTTEDGTHDLKVRVTGSDNGTGYSNQITSPESYDVISLPAAIGDPIPDPDGGPAKSQAPALSGNAWVGETLAGTVGGWKDPSTEFSRRWVRCDADGNACTYIQKPASTDPEDGSTYVVRPDDLGYTIRMRVTADVNGDISDDGIDNHLPHSVEVDTAQSAVVIERPVGVGPGGVTDTDPPVITKLRYKKGTGFLFALSEPASGVITVQRTLPGRKVGKKCKKPTRKNRKRKKCTRAKRAGRVAAPILAMGDNTVPFTKKLKPGSYRATLVATDLAQNKATARKGFKVKKKRKKR
jgi:hypothetical protein